MREIIFRGKRTDTGEWVDGDLIKLDTEVYIAGRLMWAAEPLRETVELQVSEVDPETVGQYTGLKDTNGNRIFEGDLIRHDFMAGTCFNFRVFWCDSNLCYMVDGEDSGDLSYYLPDDIEIIGTIHDNPELLK